MLPCNKKMKNHGVHVSYNFQLCCGKGDLQKEERQKMKGIFHSLNCSFPDHNGSSQPGAPPGSACGYSNPRIQATFHCSHSFINREINWNQSSQDENQHLRGHNIRLNFLCTVLAPSYLSFFSFLDLFSYFKKQSDIEKREIERNLASPVHSSNGLSGQRGGTSQEPRLHLGLPHGGQEPKYLGHLLLPSQACQQEAG